MNAQDMFDQLVDTLDETLVNDAKLACSLILFAWRNGLNADELCDLNFEGYDRAQESQREMVVGD